MSSSALRAVSRSSRAGTRKRTHQHPLSLSQCRRALSTTRCSLQAQSAATASSSINEDEIAHFSRLSAHWWDERPGSEFALLHRMNPARVSFIRDKIREAAALDDDKREWTFETRELSVVSQSADGASRPLAGQSVLDIGCGGGLLSSSLARLGARTLGIDASAENIKIAAVHASHDPYLSSPQHLTYRHVSAESLVEEDTRFDAVCALEVLEHVDQPAEFLRTCAELVKPGGHLFLSTISRTPLAYLLTILAAEHALRLVTPGTHTYAKYVRPDELVDFFSNPLAQQRRNAGEPGKQSRPWITRTYAGQPARNEAEVRGLLYVPWKATWELAPRGVPFATECNYIFWVRKPVEE